MGGGRFGVCLLVQFRTWRCAVYVLRGTAVVRVFACQAVTAATSETG